MSLANEVEYGVLPMGHKADGGSALTQDAVSGRRMDDMCMGWNTGRVAF